MSGFVKPIWWYNRKDHWIKSQRTWILVHFAARWLRETLGKLLALVPWFTKQEQHFPSSLPRWDGTINEKILWWAKRACCLRIEETAWKKKKDTAESHGWRKSQWGGGNLPAKRTCPGVVEKGWQVRETEKSSISIERQYNIAIRSRLPRFKDWLWHLPAIWLWTSYSV